MTPIEAVHRALVDRWGVELSAPAKNKPYFAIEFNHPCRQSKLTPAKFVLESAWNKEAREIEFSNQINDHPFFLTTTTNDFFEDVFELLKDFVEEPETNLICCLTPLTAEGSDVQRTAGYLGILKPGDSIGEEYLAHFDYSVELLYLARNVFAEVNHGRWPSMRRCKEIITVEHDRFREAKLAFQRDPSAPSIH
jgi:hypothetical protein